MKIEIESNAQYENAIPPFEWTVAVTESGVTKIADRLSWDEMLGLMAAITMPTNKPCKHWLKTKEQIESEKNNFSNIKQTKWQITNSTNWQ